MSTPYKRWYGRKPDLSNLNVFGCVGYAHAPDSQLAKLNKKAEKMRFVSYSIHPPGYRLHDEKTHNVVVHGVITFNENDFGQSHSEAQEDLTWDEESAPLSQEPSELPEPCAEPEESEYSRWSRQPPIRFGVSEYVYTTTCDKHTMEPIIVKEALGSEHSREWKAAADSEYQSLIENNTWELVKLPADRSATGCE